MTTTVNGYIDPRTPEQIELEDQASELAIADIEARVVKVATDVLAKHGVPAPKDVLAALNALDMDVVTLSCSHWDFDQIPEYCDLKAAHLLALTIKAKLATGG